MTNFRLIDLDEIPAIPKHPSTVSRAYCPTCHEFSVTPEENACRICQRPLDRRYDFVDVDPGID